MRKITQTIVGTTPPLDKNVLWLDTTNSNSPVEKVFLNGAWIPTSAAGGDYYTKDEVDENFMGKIDDPHVGNILVMDENGKAVDSLTKPADFIANPEVAGHKNEVLSVDSDGNPVWTTITPTGAADDKMSSTSTNAVQNKAIKEYVDSNFARQDGWYDTLVSGAAKNLVGHGTTPAEYTFRTSGGNADIGTGTATIDVLKGKTLKWQQKVQNGNYAQGTTGVITFRGTVSVSDGIATYSYSTLNSSFGREIVSSTIQGHKYYVSGILNVPATPNVRIISNYTVLVSFAGSSVSVGVYKKYRAIITAPSTTSIQFGIISAEGATSYTSKGEMCIDLTDLFGAGNEPSTPEEFEALYPLDYYAYTDTPVLINNAASGIVTTGFNQINEAAFVNDKWLNKNDGTISSSSTTVGRKATEDYFKVIPSQNYYFGAYLNGELLSDTYSLAVCFYDINKTYIIGYNIDVSTSVIQAPENATYLRIATNDLRKNVCVNLSWSGYRNGEYEPYEQHTLYFNGESGSLATVTGVAEGGSTSEVIFPEGLKSVYNVYDEIKGNTAVKRLIELDMGDIDYVYAYGYFQINKATYGLKNPTTTNTLVSNLYTVYNKYSADNLSIMDGNIVSSGFASKILIQNTSYTDVATFKQAMAGIKIIFELATPITYTLDTPIPVNYLVNDFGTEQRIPVDTANNVQSPVNLEVAYSMNAADTVRRLPINYVSAVGKDSSTPSTLDNLLTCLGAALNGTFTKSAYNETQKNYTFTFTPNETPGE